VIAMPIKPDDRSDEARHWHVSRATNAITDDEVNFWRKSQLMLK
jgi:hypothetical protein